MILPHFLPMLLHVVRGMDNYAATINMDSDQRSPLGRTWEEVVQAEQTHFLPGPEATPNDYPFMVYYTVARKTSTNGKISVIKCDGSLIEPDIVLTAAHCVSEALSPETTSFSIKAYVGISEPPKQSSLPTHGDEISAVRVMLHKNFNETGWNDNDVAILLLERPFAMSALDVELIRYSTNTNQYQPLLGVGDKCSMPGWGLQGTLETSPTSEVLRHLPVLVYFKLLTNHYPHGYILGHVSAGYGDSGGPLICKHETDTRWTQIGVVSSGPSTGKVVFFADTEHFAPWIENTIKILRRSV